MSAALLVLFIIAAALLLVLVHDTQRILRKRDRGRDRERLAGPSNRWRLP